MANGLYVPYKNRMLGSGSLTLADWDTTAPTAVLIDTADYTVNLTTHDAFDDVAAAARVASQVLAGVAISAGAVDANDTTFSAVSGDQSEAIIVYTNTGGADSTDPLHLYYDTFTSGMPVTPNGGDITVVWNASGLFTL